MDIQDGEFTYRAWKCKACERGFKWDDVSRTCAPRRNLVEEIENCQDANEEMCTSCKSGYFFDG